MPATTPIQDAQAFDDLLNQFPKKPAKKGIGNLVLAGVHWPPLTITTTLPKLPSGLQPPPITKPNPGATFKRKDAETAVNEARAIIVPSLLAVRGAVSGGIKDHVPLMTKWFGARPVAPLGANQRDWWEGVETILGVIEAFITGSINLYYRGDDSLLGKPNDYPGMVGKLNAADLRGYAETYAGALDSTIGLCKTFFAKQVGTGQARMNLKGFDSVGGTLIHELSHNLCATEDHEKSNGKSFYGTADCLTLASTLPRQAWYNADNIEYFCEELHYGSKKAAPISTGATGKFADLQAKFKG